jgi:hypothetical protein
MTVTDMKKYLLLLLTTLAVAQKPFSRQNTHNTFAIKGLAYINFLDGGYGGELGLEKGFAKQHSIGIKYVYDLQTPHSEASEENNYKPINYSHYKIHSYILEYKYYFDFKFLENYTLSPYVSLSYKGGTRTLENDKAYPHDYYYRTIKYNLVGPGIGATVLLDQDHTWTIDTQFTYFTGKKDVVTDDAQSTVSKMDRLRFELLIAYNFDW